MDGGDKVDGVSCKYKKCNGSTEIDIVTKVATIKCYFFTCLFFITYAF